MDEERIIYLLKNRDLIIESINRQRDMILKNIESKDEIINRLSIPTKEIKHDVLSRTNKKEDMTFNLLEQVYKEQEKQVKQQYEDLLQLDKEEKELNGLIRKVQRLKEPGRSIICELYLKKNTIENICYNFNIYKNKLYILKEKALKNLLESK